MQRGKDITDQNAHFLGFFCQHQRFHRGFFFGLVESLQNLLTQLGHHAVEGSLFAAEGGSKRLEKVFEGRLGEVLSNLSEAAWREGA